MTKPLVFYAMLLMFSGVVEQVSPAMAVKTQGSLLKLILKRPVLYKSLKEGESISVDGVCLTLEKFDKKIMTFGLGPETLRITGWTVKKLKGRKFNLERSITLQSTIGGHLLTGHVDGLACVSHITKEGRSRFVKVQIPKQFKKFFFKKGYIALNGVSLTVNQIKGRTLELCLIPKTLKLTNLSSVQLGDFLNFEVDYMSRLFISSFKAFCKQTKTLKIHV